MAKDKRSVIIYVDWITTFNELEDIEAGQLIKHFFRYVNDENPEPQNRLIKLLFEPIKQSLKRDLRKYEDKRLKNTDNANKRWHNNNATVCDGIKNNAKHAVSDSDSDSDSVNVNDIKKKKNIAVCSTAERSKLFYESLLPFTNRHGKDRLRAFFDYWTEPNKSGTKMRFELEKTWELSRRLNTWESREKIKPNGDQKPNTVFLPSMK